GNGSREAQAARLGDRQEAAGGRRAADHLAFAPRDLLVAASQGRHHHDEQLVQRLALRGCLARSVSCTSEILWCLLPSSWPGLSRPSTSLMLHGFDDVEARDISAFTRGCDALCAGITV